SGNMVVDIGGGTTDIVVYSEGGVVHSSTVPVGGNMLTNDIALGLKTTFADAEAVKRVHGAGADEGDGDPGFPVHTLDGRTQRMVTRAQLRAIVVPRMMEIFRMAKTHISEHVPRDLMLAEVVITGGGAHLRGIEALATECFGVPVRIGVPTAVGGLMDAVRQPQYATAVGLVLFGPKGDGSMPNGRRRKSTVLRMMAWLGDIWS
ncbi:MAG TPA: cell division FtsA domain-containing protein, partial [Candidatus Baltobacteraceae bacterium]